MAPKNFRRLPDISPQSRTQEKWSPEQSRHSACMLKHESDGASTRGEVWADRCFKGIVFETPQLPGVWHPCVNRALIDNGDSPALVIDAVREAGPFDASRPDLGDVRILDGAGREVPYLNVYAGSLSGSVRSPAHQLPG